MTLFSSLRIVHQTRNRIRFRYSQQSAFDQQSMKRLLELKVGILRVEFGQLNRTIRVYFDHEIHSVDDILRMLQNFHSEALVALERDKDNNGSEQVHNVFKGVMAFALTPLVPPPLRMALALFACTPAIMHGVRHLLSARMTSETMESAAILISLSRRDFTAAHITNLLISLAEYIGHRIDRQSDELLLSLVQPEADRVWIRRDNEDLLIPAAGVTKGMTVIAQAGETIAVDGTILEGQASINEVSMTGEALPVAKSRGDRVISGTMVEEGRVHIYAEQVGQERVSFRIASYVESSLQSKSNAHLKAIRLADRLVPFSLSLAALSYIVSRDPAKVAAVLQADYSCALKLATPVAFKAAMYRAGTHQLLVKSANALEKLAEAEVFIFDKT